MRTSLACACRPSKMDEYSRNKTCWPDRQMFRFQEYKMCRNKRITFYPTNRTSPPRKHKTQLLREEMQTLHGDTSRQGHRGRRSPFDLKLPQCKVTSTHGTHEKNPNLPSTSGILELVVIRTLEGDSPARTEDGPLAMPPSLALR